MNYRNVTKEMTTMLLHEFYSDEDCSRGLGAYRKATVFAEPDGSYTVYMMQDGAIVEERNKGDDYDE